MNILNACLVASLLAATPALADKKVEEEILQDFIERTTVSAKEIKNDDVSKCFSGTLYDVSIETEGPTYSSSLQDSLYVKKGDDLILITEPGTDAEMPALLDIVNPDFKLKSEDDGKALMRAIKVLFPSTFDDEIETRYEIDGGKWSLIVNDFFDDFSGFVFETDADGKITKVSRSLSIKG